jgi:hypothetical protein
MFFQPRLLSRIGSMSRTTPWIVTLCRKTRKIREYIIALAQKRSPRTRCYRFFVGGGARSRQLRIPQNLAVTGFDDIPAAKFITPQLIRIHQPTTRKSMGRANIRQCFPASTRRLRNGIICRRYSMARASKRCSPRPLPTVFWNCLPLNPLLESLFRP